MKGMNRIFTSIIWILIASCNYSPEVKVIHQIDTVFVRDTVDLTCYECIDSAYNAKKNKLDSLRNTKIYNNLLIQADSTTKAEVYFDEKTGKPVLKLGE